MNTTTETNELLAAAHAAAAKIGGTYLAEDAVQAAFKVLAECWAGNIRHGYGSEGPSKAEVRQMIEGDILDTIDAMERLLGAIKRQAV